MSTDKWTKDQLKLAFHLYCQLPFGKLHQRNPQIIELASLITRTPSAVAMKLVNFASLDPAITDSGRKGLGNASRADREVWNEFHRSWETLTAESTRLRTTLGGTSLEDLQPEVSEIESYVGATRAATVEIRLKQGFFRRAVLSSYEERCCMSGIAEPRLLTASHIVPWAVDRENRLNPRNGLCLSALHDRAFDQRLITVTPDLKIHVSAQLTRHAKNKVLQQTLLELEGRSIRLPGRFVPNPDFLKWHSDQFAKTEQDMGMQRRQFG